MLAITYGSMSRFEKNSIIELPEFLYTGDGRKIIIRTWSPVLAVDDLPSVTVEGYIVKEDSKNNK